jgi:hypothetical protein
MIIKDLDKLLDTGGEYFMKNHILISLLFYISINLPQKTIAP